jgi:seryl-tRNA synthetase
MIDVGILRERPHDLAAALSRRGFELDVAALVQIDADRRTARADAEEMRSRQKDAGKSIAGLSGDEKSAAIAEAGELSERYKAKVAEADDLDSRFMEQWVTVPNLADETAADGFEEEDSVEVARWGQPPAFDFEAKDHVDLGVALDLIDIERATKISGSRFGMIKGKLALLEMAMTRWSMDVLADHGFTPVVPPVLVREQALFGTGFFPADREQVYSVKEDDLRGSACSDARRRDPLRWRPTVALHRVLDLFPGGGRYLRQGHPRDLPCPPVQQGGDVLVRGTGRLARRTRIPVGT